MKWIKYIKLIRPINLLIIGLTFIVINIFLSKRTVLNNDFLVLHYLSAISLIVVASAGYILNDIQDFRIDLINKPERVIIGKFVTRKNAKAFYLILVLTSILLSCLQSYLSHSFFPLIMVLLINLSLIVYSIKLKRVLILGNLVVAFILCTPVFFSMFNYSIIFGQRLIISYYLFILAFSILLINFAREIIKDVEDIKGDKQLNCKTFPIVFGVFWSKVLSILALVLVMTIYLICFKFFLILIILTPLLLNIVMIITANDKSSFSYVSTSLKISMFSGMILYCLF